MGHEVADIDFVRDKDKMDELLKQDADLLISYKGSGINPRWIEMVKCPTVLWYPDDVLAAQHAQVDLRAFGYAYDYIYYFDEAGLNALKSLGIRNPVFLPLAADPEVFKPQEIEKEYDVSFVGNVYPNRRAMLDRLRKRFNVYETKAYMEEMANIFNRSRIVLNLGIGKTGYPLRVFETLACGSFLLTNEIHPRFRIFEDKKHLAYFNDSNIENLVEYYLANGEEREAIAKRGHEESKKHTFELRMERILKDIRSDTLKSFAESSIHNSELKSYELKQTIPQESKELKINKLADIQDLNQVARGAVIERLLKMKHTIDKTGLPYSNHMQDHWLRLWEYSGAIIESHLDKRMKVLDAGGTGTIFSYYLAAEGCDVHTVDIMEEKVRDAKILSEELGLNMQHSVQSITKLSYPDCYFDATCCICVIEHLPKEEQPVALKELSRILKPGGILSLTFDYGRNAKDNPILNPDEVITRLVIPSGLRITGNEKFHAASNDLGGTSMDYTFGSLFLKKPGELKLQNSRQISVETPAVTIKSSKMITTPAEDITQEKMPVVFISIDSLRHNYLGYGNKTVETPTIDELAGEAAVFTRATTLGIVTTMAHICMLTGTNPRKNGALNFPNYNPRCKDMFTKLSETGYKTRAFAMYGMILEYGYKNWNLDKNEQYEGAADSPGVHLKIMDWLKESVEDKFLLFLHYWKVHSPYGLELNSIGKNRYGADTVREIVRLVEAGELSLEDVRTSYRRQVQSVSEEHLKPIFDVLKQNGIYDNCLIILTSDHGEGLGYEPFSLQDFRNFTHNRMNESVIRVPLIMKFPKPMGLKETIDEPVTHLDILPTIYSLIPGITFRPDEEKLDGRNLLPLLKRRLHHEELVIADQQPQVQAAGADDNEKVRKRLEALGYL